VDNINVFTNVSVEEAQGSAPVMDVFPNPATTQLRISASSLQLGNYRIQLFDLTGKLVSETSVFAAGSRLERNVELTDLANGQYIVALVGEREIVRKSFSIVR
jgi:hypothetical protein